MKFNKLTVIKSLGKSKDNHRLWECLCDCGNSYIGYASRIRTEKIKQCKICSIEQLRESKKTHGMKYSSEYSSWVSIKDRCLNPKSKDYHRYGAKGISICSEWANSFEEFFKHIGKKQKGQSVDRIDNTKGYESGNVRWATNSQQQRNKSNSIWVVWNGKNTHISDIAKELNITRGAAIMRYKRGKLCTKE
jgi:hypothetical protein